MKKFITICLIFLCSAGIKAQPFGFPIEKSILELYSEPIIGLDNLYVGDEGYITFSVINNSDYVYRGPLYIRIFEREHSYQILVHDDIKIYPERVYEITTIFPTDRLAPYVRFFIGFEYLDNDHLFHITNYKQRPIPSFSMLSPIINRPPNKAPVKPRIKQYKISKYHGHNPSSNIEDNRTRMESRNPDPRANATRQNNNVRRPEGYDMNDNSRSMNR